MREPQRVFIDVPRTETGRVGVRVLDADTRGVGERVSHVYQRGGRYTAVVTADDGSGALCSTATGIVSVFLNHPPVARMRIRGGRGMVLTAPAASSDRDRTIQAP